MAIESSTNKKSLHHGQNLVFDHSEGLIKSSMWQEGDLNSRPRAYESPALPLSYPANGNGLLTNPKKYCQLKIPPIFSSDIDKLVQFQYVRPL